MRRKLVSRENGAGDSESSNQRMNDGIKLAKSYAGIESGVLFAVDTGDCKCVRQMRWTHAVCCTGQACVYNLRYDQPGLTAGETAISAVKWQT